MQNIVFLGIFDKIANWIMSGITKVLTWLVTNIIAPVCSLVWENALKYVVEFVGEIVATFVYKIYAFILTILYAIETAVYSFAGATDVSYQGKQDNIVSLIFDQPAVSKAFWFITAIALVLLFIFTVISVMRSTLDFGYDGRRSVGNIMTNFITSAVTFLILPALCYGLIDLTSRVMNALFVATSTGGVTSVTDSLFLLSVSANVGDTSLEPAIQITQENFNNLSNMVRNNEMFWYNLNDVLPYIHRATNVDLIVGLIGALVLIFNLLAMAATFIQRVIEIIVLYIVSPLFTATMPLDDGERFGRWRRTFIGRLCMGVGMIVALNITMLVISIVISGTGGYSISFTEPVEYTSDVVRAASNKALDIILKLIFVIGCIMSVRSIGNTITSMIDQDAGSAEKLSMDETKNMFLQAPRAVGRAVGMAKSASDFLSRSSNEFRKESIMKGSVSRGFRGEVANQKEQSFADMIKRQNTINSSKATFTKRGGKYSALMGKTAEGNKLLQNFRNLKTHGEREKFMADFNKKGGIGSLKVDSSKFGSSEMTSLKERKALSNLDKRLDNAIRNRNKFAKNSEGWKKYDAEANRLSRLRGQFDTLNTHREREGFINGHSEFSEVTKLNSVEQSVADRLASRVAQAKKARDAMPKGSAEWKKADENYQSLLQKQAQFSSAVSHSERSNFTAENIEARAEKYSSDEEKALGNIYNKKRRAVAYRDMFRKGSEGWNKFNDQVSKLEGLEAKFSSLGTREERQALIDSESAFKSEESMSLRNSGRLDNIGRNIQRVRQARDKFTPGSDQWNKLNTELIALVNARADFQELGSNDERNKFAEDKGYVFADNSSSKENKALNNIGARRLVALNNRNMFSKESPEWKQYNDEVTRLDSLAADMQSIGSKADRESFIAEHSDFSSFETSSSDKYSAALNTNIARAVANRNRHSKGSAKWIQCNEEVRQLAVEKAKYDSLATVSERESYAASHTQAFTDIMSDDKGYNRIEQSYNTWSALAQYSTDPETRTHAAKMAKSYASYSEQYQRAAGSEARQVVITNLDDFESHSANTPGIAYTSKEYEGLERVMSSGNEQIARTYVNTSSHTERSRILNDIAAGKVERYEYANKGEENYGKELIAIGGRYGEMAKTESDPEIRNQYEAMERFCYEAGTRYEDLNTHAKREAFAEYVAAQTAPYTEKSGVSMPSVPVSERERIFAGELNSEQKAEFESLESHNLRSQYMDTYYMTKDDHLTFSSDEMQTYQSYFGGSEDTEYEKTAQYKTDFIKASTHEEREQVMQDYANYITSVSESESPHNWNKFDTEGLVVNVVSSGTTEGGNTAQTSTSAAEQSAPEVTSVHESGMGSTVYESRTTPHSDAERGSTNIPEYEVGSNSYESVHTQEVRTEDTVSHKAHTSYETSASQTEKQSSDTVSDEAAAADDSSERARRAESIRSDVRRSTRPRSNSVPQRRTSKDFFNDRNNSGRKGGDRK